MSFKAGPLDVVAVGGTDRQGGGDGPAILLCHGFGAPAEDLVPLARVVDVRASSPGLAGSPVAPVRWFFPAAPLELDLGFGMAGRAWWPIDMVRLQEQIGRGQRDQMMHETPAGLADARAALEGCIDALVKERAVRRDRLVIGGFSQGAMITTEIALHASEPFAGLVVMSGALVSADRWAAAVVGAGPGLHVLQSHGRADPLLPFAGAERLRALLEGAGASVDWVPHGGQHEIPPPVLARLGTFASARLG